MSGLAVRSLSAGRAGVQGGYAVFEGETRLSGAYGSSAEAHRRMERILRERASTRRPCLCCGVVIRSEGAHHRLCEPCRARDPDEPFALALAGAR